ncbi:MAG: tyrosine-type recombinase/integrase [Solirubrobacteraceae bacterium]
MALSLEDRLALGVIEAALKDARDAMDARPALEVLTDSLAKVRARGISSEHSAGLALGERDAWLRQMHDAQRSKISITATRAAIDDLLAWAQRERRTEDIFNREAIIDYLKDYRQRLCPAPSTYRNRFVQLRSFMVWLSRRHGTPNPFDALPTPSPHYKQEWLTREEFVELLAGAANPSRDVPGTVERDTLVLMTFLLTGMEGSELIALRWAEVDLDGRRPSLFVCSHRARRPRHRPLPIQFCAELRRWRVFRSACQQEQVFCGPAGGRLDKEKLEQIIARAAARVMLQKHVTPQTLRHTGATWLREAGASRTLIAEYLGEAGREDEKLRAAVQSLADHVVHDRPLTIEGHR